MHINSIQNYNYKKIDRPQFKAAYPVYHWVAEEGSRHYAVAVSPELNKSLQSKLVRLFNSTSRFANTLLGKELIEKLKATDFGYKFNQVVRSYYNHKGGWDGKFNAIGYLITGNDVAPFDEKFGKNIGRSASISPKINGKRTSAEYNAATTNYKLGGLNFVTDPKKKIKDSNGVEYGLHTKFEVRRSKTGKIKSYELVDIKFCPETGKDNPFVKLGYHQNQK